MLRILRFNNKSTTEVQVQFTEDLAEGIGVSNVLVRSNVANQDDLVVKSVRIKKSVISIETNPQVPLALYYVEFVSTDEQAFANIDGDEIQDSERTFYFLGQERANDIRDNMLDRLPATYDLDQDSLSRRLVSNLADSIFKARTDIREIANANFLSEEVNDEIKVRGFNPNDRLNNEGAYKVLRVSKNPEGSSETQVFSFISKNATDLLGSAGSQYANRNIVGFPGDPFSLRSVEVREEIVSNAETIANKFDGTLITVGHSNVVSLSAVKLIKENGDEYIYDIPSYGYSLLDNRYDTVYGRKLLTLESNQIKLSDLSILNGDFEVPTAGDEIEVSYFYIDNGINVNTDTISVSLIKSVTRESCPALLNVFSLDHFPIVLSNDTIPTLSGITFLDPNPSSGSPFTTAHPAFRTELPFDRTRLPSGPGQFSVDYSTGQVFVYGASSNNGSGIFPPVATYLYRKEFINEVDFNIDLDADEIVAVPSRDLIGQKVKLVYEVERVLAEGVDWLNESHVEVLNEYVENKFISPLQISTTHTPITNVFEVVNETTGERYGVSRYNDNYIFLSGRQIPEYITRENEQATFKQATNETLFVNEELDHNPGTKIFKASLLNSEVLSYGGQKLADNVNTSLSLTNDAVFIREFYFDSVLQTLAQNLSKLTTIGDYIVDYANGHLYVVVDEEQSYDIGAASYTYSAIEPVHAQVLSVDEVTYRKTIKSTAALTLETIESTSDEILLSSLPAATERFYNDDSNLPIILGSVQQGVVGQTFPDSFEFTASDGNFVSTFADGNHILRIVGDTDRQITSVTSSKTLLVDTPFTGLDRSVGWCIIDFNLSDGYGVVVSKNISSIKGIYSVDELQTLDRDSLTNYWNPEVDTFDGNEITFNNETIATLDAGTALAIDYSYGTVYVNYTYVKDVLRVSYEYGDNSLNFGKSEALSPEEQYFVSYRYGALREKLLQNFGSLTNISELTSFPLDFDRETYRNFLIGTLQAFVNGPTNPSIKTLVESVTEIKPEIKELTFNEWTAGRDNLHLQEGNFVGTELYKQGRFNNGLYFDEDSSLSYPEESYVSYRDGTFQAWVLPGWNGINNDTSLTVETSFPVEDVFIGASGWSPEAYPFVVNRFDEAPISPVGRPVNYATTYGAYLWFDEEANSWLFHTTTDGYGRIDSDGDISFASGSIRSGTNYIEFDGYGDGYNGESDGYDGYLTRIEISLRSDRARYLMDAGAAVNHNRISMFKDSSGFLNFRVIDDTGRLKPSRSKVFNISTDITDWAEGERHLVSAAWRLNSAEGIDEMHLFVDGQETSNLLKWGGRPQSGEDSIYRSVASEEIVSVAAKNTIGGSDGVSISGSQIFSSISSTFATDNIAPGDELSILDATTDGVGGPYTISAVGETSLQLSAPLLLSLSGINFSVNRASIDVESNIDIENFIVKCDDGYGDIRELNGLDSEEPDYSISRAAGINTIHINDGIRIGDTVVINTLGLNAGRNRNMIYLEQDGYNILSSRGAPPASLDHLEVYKIIVPRGPVHEYDPLAGAADGYFESVGFVVDGYFTGFSQPSNTVNGKTLAVTLGQDVIPEGGIVYDLIDFSGTNTLTIYGSTFSGATQETIVFTDYGTYVTDEFFTSIDAIEMTFDTLDPDPTIASLEIKEAVPFTQTENAGDYAIVSKFYNGTLVFEEFGSGGLPWDLEGETYYLVDYPINLNISMNAKGNLVIGNSLDKLNGWGGTIDQVVFLNEMLNDIRVGEDREEVRTVTQDFNSPVPMVTTPQTLMLLNFDNKIENVQKLYKSFDEKFITSSVSVNEDFGDALVALNNSFYKVDNGEVVFNANEGSIEFWVSPLLDTYYDKRINRYYIDTTSIRTVRVTSNTALTLTLPIRAKSVQSVRLIDDSGTGINYFQNGKLLIDGKNILLKERLPGAQTIVDITYIPIDANGDRFSIFKDPDNNLNFAITANDELFMISYPIEWERNSWHRVKATWQTNSSNNQDSMRLFVDGAESGTIFWGTAGLLYGSGVVYGQALVGVAGSNTLVANIDLEDTFSEIYIGNSFEETNSAAAKMDNIRFSNEIRDPEILASSAVDLNYNSNSSSVFPVVSDNITTLLLDFDRLEEETEFLSNLLSKYTPLFQLDVEIDDSFTKLTQDRYKTLLESILTRMKPAHSRLHVKYID